MILILMHIKKSQPILFDINLSQLYLTYQTNNRHIIQKYPQNMFFFKSCCSGTNNTDAFGSQNAYRVVSKNQKQQQNVRYFQSYDQIDKKCFASPYFHVLKIQKSKYEEQIKSLSGSDLQWIDNQFEPDQKSLGNIPNVNNGRWLRLANILNKPALFDGKIQPKDIVQQSADCYFLSAVAALAQNQQHIRNIFGNQKYNKNGIYVVTLRINGIIKQILVDDFVPANNKGQPLFSKPNKNQFWLPILEKAWAKANRSYENIISGNPGQIFKAVTYAPSIAYSIKQNQQQCEKIWKQIISSRKQNRPCCCQTDEEADESWQKLGLMAGQGYTIIQAEQLIGKGQKTHRMLILRNVHNKLEWTGQGNERDEQFWNKIKNTKQKQKFIKNKNKMHDGIMFINYNDFCKYFSMVYFSLYQKGAHYFSEQFIPDADIATCFLFKVDKKGNYILQLHQPADHNKYKSSLDEEEYVNRSTLILARRLIDNTKQKQDINDQDFQFINGIMKYSQTDTTLSVELQPGDYLIYTKIDPLRKSNQMPETASLSVYTKQLINLNQIQLDKNAQARILHKMFLNHAKLNKRQTHNDEKMWISWKLLFQQGGFAYIAFGNSEDSDKKFIVTLHQNDFDEMKFQLIERPLQKQKVLIVQPNEQLIILSKVKNQIFKGIKFPPQMQIKLEKVHHP